ncbi:hypothetical protein COO60DRAFT_1486879 [Scenedesmus sp. NREL 46B-D3]|nr:hypothetical protein COO60DRAFT_1486879 [Scenedesmus sp. NREL 46B-D3]
MNSSSLTSSLARLTGLRELSLWGSLDSTCLAVVGQLAQLTRTSIETTSDCDLRLLPPQLQHLNMQVGGKEDGGAVTVALGHLSALQDLSLALHCSKAAAKSSLPTSITALTLQHTAPDAAEDGVLQLDMPSLHNLQELVTHDCLHGSEQLLALAAPPALMYISLSHGSVEHAVSAAPAWPLLPALRALSLDDEDEPLPPELSRPLLQHLAAATSLRQLRFFNSSTDESVPMCAYLTGLTQLQHLEVTWQHPATRADALQLTLLSLLTALCIGGGEGADDTAVVALALRLRRLQQLQLTDCGFLTAAVLPAIATLARLTALVLSFPRLWPVPEREEEPLGQEDLQLLTPLRQLRKLNGEEFFSKQALQELWDAEQGR